MNFQKVLDSRISVRSFEKKKVPKKTLISLIKDATKAPSTENSQPWKFYILSSQGPRRKISNLLRAFLLKNKEEFDKLSPNIRKVAYQFYSDIGGCQTIVFAFMLKNLKYRDSALASVACACQNLILSSTNKGLGTCWVGSFKSHESEIKKIVNASKNEELIGSILIGYPSRDFKPLKRSKKKLSEVMKFI